MRHLPGINKYVVGAIPTTFKKCIEYEIINSVYCNNNNIILFEHEI
jgi:hypothetical protein